MSLQGRIAWVTGGGRGIGRACALALARQGARVAVSARSSAELRAVADECSAQGPSSAAVLCDVTQRAEVERAHREIVERLGPPTLLVLAAGVARSETFLRTTEEQMLSHWRLNALGAFHPMQVCLPAMLQAGTGRVVAIASTAAKAGAPYVAAYASSKHALLGLVRSVAAEVAAKGITVNAVCPGYVNTNMTQENVRNIVNKTGLSPEQALERLRDMSPQRRLMEPEEVAAMVAHLCRDEAQGIHGQAITIDGGALQW